MQFFGGMANSVLFSCFVFPFTPQRVMPVSSMSREHLNAVHGFCAEFSKNGFLAGNCSSNSGYLDFNDALV